MNTTNRIYESLYIIDSTLTDDQVESIIAKYAKVVTDQGGEVQAAGKWDKRRLAYDVKGHREGTYILMYFHGEPAVSDELDRLFRIADDVFRHIIVRVEPEHIDTSRIDHPQPSAEPAVAAPVEVAAEAEAEAAEPAEAPAEVTVEAEVVEAPAAEAPAEEPAAEASEEPAVEAAEEAVEEVVETPAEPEAAEAEAAPEEPVVEEASEETVSEDANAKPEEKQE